MTLCQPVADISLFRQTGKSEDLDPFCDRIQHRGRHIGVSTSIVIVVLEQNYFAAIEPGDQFILEILGAFRVTGCRKPERTKIVYVSFALQ